MPEASTTHPSSVKSADRALDLLELFDRASDGLTLAEVCAITGWPKSSTLGLMRTLEQRQYLDTSYPDGRYRIGPRVASLGLANVAHLDIARQGAEVVREVSRCCDETVHLAVLRRTDVLYVAKEEGGGHMRMVSVVGRMIPAHGTGVGTVLLAGLPPDQLDRLFPPDESMPRLTDRTVIDPVAFRQRLELVRARHYAEEHGESTVGLCCFAAPVLGLRAEVIAAMSVSVPEPRFTVQRRPHLLATLVAGTRRLSHRMGCPTGSYPDIADPNESELSHGAG